MLVLDQVYAKLADCSVEAEDSDDSTVKPLYTASGPVTGKHVETTVLLKCVETGTSFFSIEEFEVLYENSKKEEAKIFH